MVGAAPTHRFAEWNSSVEGARTPVPRLKARVAFVIATREVVMRRNVGRLDQAFRIAFGLSVITIGLIYGSWWGALGLIPLFTGVVGWCPVYLPFGTSTYRKPIHREHEPPRKAA
jgi:hypothetical protein